MVGSVTFMAIAGRELLQVKLWVFLAGYCIGGIPAASVSSINGIFLSILKLRNLDIGYLGKATYAIAIGCIPSFFLPFLFDGIDSHLFLGAAGLASLASLVCVGLFNTRLTRWINNSNHSTPSCNPTSAASQIRQGHATAGMGIDTQDTGIRNNQ